VEKAYTIFVMVYWSRREKLSNSRENVHIAETQSISLPPELLALLEKRQKRLEVLKNFIPGNLKTVRLTKTGIICAVCGAKDCDHIKQIQSNIEKLK
jgi:hypothetical protein